MTDRSNFGETDPNAATHDKWGAGADADIQMKDKTKNQTTDKLEDV